MIGNYSLSDNKYAMIGGECTICLVRDWKSEWDENYEFSFVVLFLLFPVSFFFIWSYFAGNPFFLLFFFPISFLIVDFCCIQRNTGLERELVFVWYYFFPPHLFYIVILVIPKISLSLQLGWFSLYSSFFCFFFLYSLLRRFFT